MISLILPYWDRQEAANKAIEILDKQYAGLIYNPIDLEVMIVDDGNPIWFKLPESYLNIKVLRLEEKTEPKSPARAWNMGIKACKGDIVVLSCVEILHDHGPVLQKMQEELERLGPDGYVLAAAWCPEFLNWHCHSSVTVPDCPGGTGIGFLGMMNKELYNRIGGFDEEFMKGAGYEDRDFIRKLCAAGVKFKICDDLIVTHPKSGASIEWSPNAFAINERLFYSKWN